MSERLVSSLARAAGATVQVDVALAEVTLELTAVIVPAVVEAGSVFDAAEEEAPAPEPEPEPPLDEPAEEAAAVEDAEPDEEAADAEPKEEVADAVADAVLAESVPLAAHTAAARRLRVTTSQSAVLFVNLASTISPVEQKVACPPEKLPFCHSKSLPLTTNVLVISPMIGLTAKSSDATPVLVEICSPWLKS